MRVAALQLSSGREVERNLEAAGRLLKIAAGDGVELAVLPENFSFLGATDAERLAAAEQPGEGSAQEFLSAAASEHGVWIVGGTIPILQADGRAKSRSLLVGPDGLVVAQYDKIHLFDVDVPGKEVESYHESATTACGSEPVVADTAFARIGMSVCYDLRFPALFHRLGVLGMDVLVVPAAFTVPTGRVHWQQLLQARAIEGLVFVIAAGQFGEHAGGRRTYGHSMIIGPWGDILALRPEGAGIVSAEVDMIGLRNIRRQFPALEHRREL